MAYTNEQIEAAHADMQAAVAWGRERGGYEDLHRFVERRVDEDEQTCRDSLRAASECEAKRALIEEAGTYPTNAGERILKILACVYRFHPDFTPEWGL